MPENKIPLLSIVIPTKNRQFTCLYAIESALLINNNDFEVIVQDCSDANILQQQIQEKFGLDPRIKYFYSAEKLSMTDNWNRAFANTKGEYICAIGDDDAVLSYVYELSLWAKQKDILAVMQKEIISYFWPGFTPQTFKGTLAFNNNFSESKLLVNDLKTRVLAYSKLTAPMSYISLPQAYHCLFSRKIKEQLIQLTGSFLQSTSLDVYTAIAFNAIISSYTESGLPFTIRGASKTSNSQRLFDGRSKEHFDEFKNIVYPEILPKVFGLNNTVTESFIKACETTGQKELINNIDLPLLYANIALEDKENYTMCEEKLKEYVSSAIERKRFYKHYYGTKRKKFLFKIKTTLFTFLKKYTPFVYKGYRKIFPLQVVTTLVHAETIKDALDFLKQPYIFANINDK